jgi:hypothetical protein
MPVGFQHMTCDLVCKTFLLCVFLARDLRNCTRMDYLLRPFDGGQERPCTRCIKRNIAHLCHDEPRDPDSKKTKTHGAGSHDESEAQPDIARNSIDQSPAVMGPPSFNGTGGPRGAKQAFGADALGQANPLQLVSPGSGAGMQGGGSGSSMNQCRSCRTPITAKDTTS